MIKPLEKNALVAFIERKDLDSVRAALKPCHPFDIASLLPELPPEQQVEILLSLPAKRQAQVFGYLDAEEQLALARALRREDLGRLFADMDPDERADLFKRLPAAVREAIVPGLAQAEREDIRKLAAYPESTVGAVMTSAYAAVPPDVTAREAIDLLRQEAPNRETIYEVFVIDATRELLGVVSLRELLLAPPESRVSEVMRREVVKVAAEAPRAEAARLIGEYDLIALPVTNGGGKLVGIVTADDAMEVAEQEELKRIQTFGGTLAVGGPDLDLLNSPFRQLFTARFFWLALLTVFGLATSHIVAAQEEMLEKAIVLAAFIAPIVDMGGNTGSQTATMVIRAMALGQIALRFSDFLKVLKRDLPVALALGGGVAVLEAVLAYTMKSLGWDVVAVIGLSMLACTVLGSLFGILLPFAARAMKQDPATLSSPVITSVMDLVGVLIYFGIAWIVLAHLFVD
ncbi:magnesium transporter [Elioraea tepidiphila]|uniref:magnesium transporter n=1 Tax=Elioraea tepidiphila TaxID=457934 RepID=UPI0003637DFC|nr:magnesium transporter [Elioraea tepidiphila]